MTTYHCPQCDITFLHEDAEAVFCIPGCVCSEDFEMYSPVYRIVKSVSTFLYVFLAFGIFLLVLPFAIMSGPDREKCFNIPVCLPGIRNLFAGASICDNEWSSRIPGFPGNTLASAFTSIVFGFPAQGDAKDSVIEHPGRCNQWNIVDLGGISGSVVPRNARSFIRDTATGDTSVITSYYSGYKIAFRRDNDAERSVYSRRNVPQKEALCR